MGWWLLLAVFLYFICAILIIAEVFVPSGGLISIFAFGCLVGGVVLFFQQGTIFGWIGLVLAVIMIPAVLIFAYRLFPKTRFGKSVTLAPPEREIGDAIPDSKELKKMLDAIGVVVTPLRPVGMCDFSGQRIECVAESGYVERGKKVRVIKIESTQLTVRMVQES
jgi:membrane-bound ClpP family serine protease